MPASRSDSRLRNIDALRLLAATQVVLVHGMEHLAHDAPWSKAAVAVIGAFPGVPLFFFLSGLLITMSADRSRSLAEYGLRRVLRIYPGLWVCLVVSIAGVAAAGYAMPVKDSAFWAWISAQLTFGQVYNPAFMRDFGVGVLNGSLWTIFVELQFYVVAPVMLLALRRLAQKPRALISIFVILGFVNEHAAHLRLAEETALVKLYGVTIIPYLLYFALGGVAYILGWHEREYTRKELCAALGIHVGLAAATALIVGERYGGNLLFPYLGATLCLLGMVAGFNRPFYWSRWLDERDYSFGIYLYHMPIINTLIHVFGRSGDLLIAAVVLTFGCAVASWHWIERPAIALGKRRRVEAVAIPHELA